MAGIADHPREFGRRSSSPGIDRSVRMENIGEGDVVNPWLVSGGNDLRSVKAIVARAIGPGMTDKEKAMALWWQQIQHRFHYQGDKQRPVEPREGAQHLWHNTCGNDSICLAGLWKTAGLKGRPRAAGGALRDAGVLRRCLAPVRRRHALAVSLAR